MGGQDPTNPFVAAWGDKSAMRPFAKFWTFLYPLTGKSDLIQETTHAFATD